MLLIKLTCSCTTHLVKYILLVCSYDFARHAAISFDGSTNFAVCNSTIQALLPIDISIKPITTLSDTLVSSIQISSCALCTLICCSALGTICNTSYYIKLEYTDASITGLICLWFTITSWCRLSWWYTGNAVFRGECTSTAVV